MDKRLEALAALGCDTGSAIERFLGDEQLFFTCFDSLLTDGDLDRIEQALDAQSAKEAFAYAHRLKGVCANMGLTPLYDECVKLVEPLRTGKIPSDAREITAQMQAIIGEFKQI